MSFGFIFPSLVSLCLFHGISAAGMTASCRYQENNNAYCVGFPGSCRSQHWVHSPRFRTISIRPRVSSSFVCSFSVRVYPWKRVMLEFHLSGVQSSASSVKVRDGGGNGSLIVSYQAGNKPPPLVVSCRNRINVRLRMTSAAMSSFTATYNAIGKH